VGFIQSPLRNQLLATLAPRDCEQLHPHLQLVAMPIGKVLYEHGEVMSHVYYPTSCVVSLLYVLENGGSTELAAVGNEGVVGMPLCMGEDIAPSRAIVQTAGHAYKLPAHLFKEEFNRNSGLRKSLLRYTLALITHTAQMAVCNRHHSVEQQLCRWLLLSVDRSERNMVLATQQNIANMLGVRREGVTEAALKLQKQNAIRYARGKITITNRARLESMSCECYSVVRKQNERLRAHACSPATHKIRTPVPRPLVETPVFA
jgi:CRP-like cAMP-binding protein